MAFDSTKPTIITQLRSGVEGDEYVAYTNIPLKVSEGIATLAEIPDKIQKVLVMDAINNTPYFETQNQFPSEFQYVVNYNGREVYFNPLAEGKTLSFSYYGKGISYVSADAIFTQHENGQEVIETLGQIIDAGRDGIENIYTLNTLYEDTTQVKEEVTQIRDTFVYDSSDYSATKQYKINNQVTYNGKTYICIQDSIGHSPVDTAYWRVFASGVDSLRKSKRWITTAGMTDFDISDIGKYVVGSLKLEVIVGGALQENGVNFDEISSTLFRFRSPMPAGLKVVARWFDGDVGTAAGHNAQHRKGGGDELSLGDLAGIEDFISKYINPSGTTAQRPTTNLYLGMKYFDTTLNIPIYYSGSNAWKKFSDNSTV